MDRNGGRPGRVNQWNIAVQRELVKDLAVEVAYVGNRGVWLEANDLVNANAINPARLQALGIDLNNSADRALLTTRLQNLTPAQAQRFPAPYPGFPLTATVAQSLRPFPQFDDALAVRWAPLGNNWYDSLQVTLTKRYSRGLEMTASTPTRKSWCWAAAVTRGCPGRASTMSSIVTRRSRSLQPRSRVSS